ncbi:MAG: SsrA-binding protein SmpB [Rhodospirillales bacterium]|nr:SsrA-binding protein SmpB [Rhodospirillales bacterium]
MARKNKKKSLSHGNIAAQNRKARHDYSIEEEFEAGIILTGTEVKSLRAGRATITEAYAGGKDGELYLFNAYIPEYDAASHFSHEPRRPRKLLMHSREISRLQGAVQREGMTLVPLSIYFNKRGIAKVGLALARGKQKSDKRAYIKDRDWQRQKSRLMREKG